MADYVTAEPYFDREKGDFVIVNGAPRLAVGAERVRGFIYKTLMTQFGKYKLYEGTGYGVDRKSIIGKTLPRDYIQSELKRGITEALMRDDSIISVENFDVVQDGTRLNISFKVTTEYGEEDIKETL